MELCPLPPKTGCNYVIYKPFSHIYIVFIVTIYTRGYSYIYGQKQINCYKSKRKNVITCHKYISKSMSDVRGQWARSKISNFESKVGGYECVPMDFSCLNSPY